ncbi:hypothetical protein M9458_058090 [Cirrhinus mrigala]|uniref:Uncharacterized protein n=1 Tax=Cirrhinus mrigala TaxID=683832 RepID=A0ABD0MAF2_CIRMR
MSFLVSREFCHATPGNPLTSPETPDLTLPIKEARFSAGITIVKIICCCLCLWLITCLHGNSALVEKSRLGLRTCWTVFSWRFRYRTALLFIALTDSNAHR